MHAWERFGIWLAIGLVLYFAYGFRTASCAARCDVSTARAEREAREPAKTSLATGSRACVRSRVATSVSAACGAKLVTRVMTRPLDGVRVLDLTRLLPGAYATLLLADLGADVVKVEDPRGGDGMRSLPTAGRRPYFELLNRGKRSVTLDLRSPDAAAVLDALCAKADVVVDSFRPSTARRLGVDAAALHARHPHLVCASISGFGQTGPYAERAAHDINYQALAGLLFARPSTLRQAQGSGRATENTPRAEKIRSP